jgi:hypothetical protein
MTSLAATSAALVAQPRICAGGGNYNTPSPFPGVGAGSFSYRRPGTWSQAVRRTQIGLTTRASAVIDGAYSTIAVNPATDPGDGFVYHDERVTPGLEVARIATMQTWPKQGAGFYQCQEPLLSALTSQFTELIIGNLVDAASDICYAVGVQIVNSALVCLPSGVLDPVFRNGLQAKIQAALQQGLVASGLCSAVTATISPSYNVLANSNVPIVVVVTPDAQATEVSFNVNLNTAGL